MNSNETMHTPGPWHCVTGSYLQHAAMPDGSSAAVIMYGVVAKNHKSKYAPASARLIAAAPDLLAALQKCVRLTVACIQAMPRTTEKNAVALAMHVGNGGPARAAIAKATEG